MAIGRRRRVLVDKPLQFGFLLVCFGYITAFMVMIGLALFLPLVVALSNKQPELAEAAAEQFLLLHHAFWPAVLISMILLSVHAILVSHRFAGPLYRHKMVYKEIAAGRIPRPFTARKGDFLSQESAALNGMIEGLRTRVAEIHEAEYALDEALAKLAGSPGARADAALMENLAAVSDAQERLREKTERLQTEA